MSYVHLWEQKVRCVGSQIHSINTWKRNSRFEDVRIFASHRNQIQGKKISLAHNILRVGDQRVTSFAGNRIKMTIIIIITTHFYSALIKRKCLQYDKCIILRKDRSDAWIQ